MQDLIESTSTQEAELEDAFARYEEAFHNLLIVMIISPL